MSLNLVCFRSSLSSLLIFDHDQLIFFIELSSHVFKFVSNKWFRLCLVHVKYFSKNKYFLKMLFSEKENIFRSLVIL